MLRINLFPLKSHKMLYCKNYTCPKLVLFQWYIWKFLPSIKMLKMHTHGSNSPFLLFILYLFFSLSRTHMMQSNSLRNETILPREMSFKNLYLKLDISNTWCRWMDEICEGNRWNKMGAIKWFAFPLALQAIIKFKWYTWPFQLIVT